MAASGRMFADGVGALVGRAADGGGEVAMKEETVRIWIRKGALRAVKLGGNKSGYRIVPADLDAFLASRWTIPNQIT